MIVALKPTEEKYSLTQECQMYDIYTRSTDERKSKYPDRSMKKPSTMQSCTRHPVSAALTTAALRLYLIVNLDRLYLVVLLLHLGLQDALASQVRRKCFLLHRLI